MKLFCSAHEWNAEPPPLSSPACARGRMKEGVPSFTEHERKVGNEKWTETQ
jgi:hypothetical protein